MYCCAKNWHSVELNLFSLKFQGALWGAPKLELDLVQHQEKL